MYNIHDLDCAINFQSFMVEHPMQPTLDPQKVYDAIKILKDTVINLQNENMTFRSDLTAFTIDHTDLKSKYEELLGILRKIGKDYPEIVLAKTHLFVPESGVKNEEQQ